MTHLQMCLRWLPATPTSRDSPRRFELHPRNLESIILIVVGLGFYQRLSANVEEHVEERDIAASSDRPSPEQSDR
ncbi:MAG: hypothetical protein WAK69_18490 [Rhodoplanes sp.]